MARRVILGKMDFRKPTGGWQWPMSDEPGVELTRTGCLVTASPGKHISINGDGVHTRNGDSIELDFDTPQTTGGRVGLAFTGGAEFLKVSLDLKSRRLVLSTSEWNRRQPVAVAKVTLKRKGAHTLRIDKTEGNGGLIKTADARVHWDGRYVLEVRALNVLPEMGVEVTVSSARVLLRRFVHRGFDSGIPEFLHVGGWQMLNRPDIDANLESIFRGLREAAACGVQLLITPETSLTGLFSGKSVTRHSGPITRAERKLRRFIANLKNSPYLVAGLPIWRASPSPRPRKTRYNASRVYDGDGHVVLTGPKIHSCEPNFWHGYRLNEFEVNGAPVSMHVCHDGRYPETWTLPIMFGSRLVVHPSNSGKISQNVQAFETDAKRQTSTMHAFYLRVNGGGGSALVGPGKYNNLLAVSTECRRDNPAFPMAGSPAECLLHANIRLHDAFGYWPVRSFRVSEDAADAYVRLYCSLGGGNTTQGQPNRRLDLRTVDS